MKAEYFECQCYSDEHTVKFSLDEEDGTIYASIFLNDWMPWYKRLWVGIKYIFGYKSKYGHWDNFEMRPEDYDRFTILIDNAVRITQVQSAKIITVYDNFLSRQSK